MPLGCGISGRFSMPGGTSCVKCDCWCHQSDCTDKRGDECEGAMQARSAARSTQATTGFSVTTGSFASCQASNPPTTLTTF